MKIVNHRLYHDDDTAYEYATTPNQSGSINPRFLVIHYTAGRNAEQSVNWLQRSRSSASAHIVLGRDGKIVQMVDFNKKAWHAGRSTWKGLKGLNSHSIGIELDNTGPLKRAGDSWVAWFGDRYPSDQVIEAVHKNRDTLEGWQLYTPEQLQAALDLAEVLIEQYQLEDVIGHDDIAPLRKTDPGPAFPMESFRAQLFGRPDFSEEDTLYATAVNLNIRSGPGSDFPILEGSPLPKGTRLDVLEEDGNWRQVEVLDEVRGVMDLEGWLHAKYINKI